MKKKLHILHLPKWYPNVDDPQLGIFVQKQIQAASLFHKQTVLYIKSEKELDEPLKIEVIDVNKVKEVRIIYRKPLMKSKQLIILKKVFRIGFEEVEKLNGAPDMLHIHNLITPAIWGHKYAKEKKIPWILSEHWSGYTEHSGVFQAKLSWEKKLWRLYSDKAVRTLAVSSFLKRALVKNEIGKNYTIVPNVVECIATNEVRNDKEIRILNVSDMVDGIKNISGLIRSFTSLLIEFNQAKLYLIGGGEDLEKLKKMVNDLNIDKSVRFFGRLKNEEVLSIYNEVDFVVINSRVETFSVVAAESLLAGKPVITTRCGGVEEFISEDQGILIPVGNDAELKVALLTMMRKYKEYNVAQLKAHAANQFSSKSIGEQLAKIYEESVA
jgi:glycosyltransferase involved in cell wall biosynthesis